MTLQQGIEQRFQFFTEVLQLLVDNNNDPLVVEPLLRQNPALLDDQMIEALRDWYRYELAKVNQDQQKLMAQALIVLGNILGLFPLGNKAVNMELRIKCYGLANKVFQNVKSLKKCAEVQHLLALAYRERIRGDRADNLEFSIEHYKFVLDTYPEKKANLELAEAQYNLAVVYGERIRGVSSDNLEISIEHTKLAQETLIEFFKIGTEFYCADHSEKLLFLWALGQNNLAIAYMSRIIGKKAENLDLSVQHYQSILKTYTEKSFSGSWLETQSILNIFHQIASKDQDLALQNSLNLQLAHAFYYRGFLKREKLNDLPGAVSDFKKALEISPCHAGHYGKLLALMKVPDELSPSPEVKSQVIGDQSNDSKPKPKSKKNNDAEQITTDEQINSSTPPMDDVKLVLIRSAELEDILKSKFQAKGDGLGQQVRSVEDRLPLPLVKKIKWISRIRNEASHQPLTFKMPEKYTQSCDEAKIMLEQLEISASSADAKNTTQNYVPYTKLDPEQEERDNQRIMEWQRKQELKRQQEAHEYEEKLEKEKKKAQEISDVPIDHQAKTNTVSTSAQQERKPNKLINSILKIFRKVLLLTLGVLAIPALYSYAVFLSSPSSDNTSKDEAKTQQSLKKNAPLSNKKNRKI
jgi:tetratricopeptide (TPR) repeat protein